MPPFPSKNIVNISCPVVEGLGVLLGLLGFSVFVELPGFIGVDGFVIFSEDAFSQHARNV